MLSKQHRFHGHNSLSFVYRQGSTVRNQFMSLKFARNPRRKTYRAAVIVSRKVHKSAVSRNRVRRRIYEVIRLQDNEISLPYDIVVTVFSNAVAEMPDNKLKGGVIGLLEKSVINKMDNHPPSSLPRDIVNSNETSA